MARGRPEVIGKSGETRFGLLESGPIAGKNRLHVHAAGIAPFWERVGQLQEGIDRRGKRQRNRRGRFPGDCVALLGARAQAIRPAERHLTARSVLMEFAPSTVAVVAIALGDLPDRVTVKP